MNNLLKETLWERVNPWKSETNIASCSIRRALERTSPEQAAEIMKRGVVLAGGGSLLKGLGSRLHEETNLPIYRAKDPLTAVVRGTGAVLENMKELSRVCVS